MDDLQRKREAVAAEYKIALYRQYSEKQAAAFIGIDYTTLKKKRKAGHIPYVDKGGESVGYMGYHIADFIQFGTASVKLSETPPKEAGNPAP